MAIKVTEERRPRIEFSAEGAHACAYVWIKGPKQWELYTSKNGAEEFIRGASDLEVPFLEYVIETQGTVKP